MDLGVETVDQEIQNFAKCHETRFLQHENIETIEFLDNSNQIRKLMRTQPCELV